MAEGLPRLLDLLCDADVTATFFVTGDAARRFPECVRRIVADGHELGSHGDTHADFATLSAPEAEGEIRRASAALRAFGSVTAFRAPYLRLPDAFLPLLVADGIEVDASAALYKRRPGRPFDHSVLPRVVASVPPSLIRCPAWLRRPVLGLVPDPPVLFVHPWEFVDLRSEPIPFDCRAGTGERALATLQDVLIETQSRGWRYERISDRCRGGCPDRGG